MLSCNVCMSRIWLKVSLSIEQIKVVNVPSHVFTSYSPKFWNWERYWDVYIIYVYFWKRNFPSPLLARTYLRPNHRTYYGQKHNVRDRETIRRSGPGGEGERRRGGKRTRTSETRTATMGWGRSRMGTKRCIRYQNPDIGKFREPGRGLSGPISDLLSRLLKSDTGPPSQALRWLVRNIYPYPHPD